MQDGPATSASSALGQWDMALNMVRGNAASRDGGGAAGAGAFSEAGRAAMNVGIVRELDSVDEIQGGALEKDTPAGKRQGEMAAAADQDTSTGASGKKPKTWFDRDSAIADGLRSHLTWLRKTKISLEDAVSTAQWGPGQRAL